MTACNNYLMFWCSGTAALFMSLGMLLGACSAKGICPRAYEDTWVFEGQEHSCAERVKLPPKEQCFQLSYAIEDCSEKYEYLCPNGYSRVSSFDTATGEGFVMSRAPDGCTTHYLAHRTD